MVKQCKHVTAVTDLLKYSGKLRDGIYAYLTPDVMNVVLFTV
jgi:hypothetical protein